MKALSVPPLLLIASLYSLTLATAAIHFDILRMGAAAVLAAPLIWLSIEDLTSQIIPDTAVLSVAVIGLATQFHDNGASLWTTIIAAVILLVALWICSAIYWHRNGVEALGLGDVKLIAAAALCLGATDIWTMLLLAAMGGTVATLLARRSAKPHEIGTPFGPFLAYALFLTFLFPVQI